MTESIISANQFAKDKLRKNMDISKSKHAKFYIVDQLVKG